MTIQDYQDRLQKVQSEIQYIDQQREIIAQQLVKTIGAIEALEELNKETENIETNNG